VVIIVQYHLLKDTVMCTLQNRQNIKFYYLYLSWYKKKKEWIAGEITCRYDKSVIKTLN
jgi:hypothetical protein